LLLVTFAFEVDETGEVALLQAVHAFFRQLQTKLPVLNCELGLGSDPVCFGVEYLEHDDFFEMLADFEILLSVVVGCHEEVVDV
jgi:hypothetical protein